MFRTFICVNASVWQRNNSITTATGARQSDELFNILYHQLLLNSSFHSAYSFGSTVRGQRNHAIISSDYSQQIGEHSANSSCMCMRVCVCVFGGGLSVKETKITLMLTHLKFEGKRNSNSKANSNNYWKWEIIKVLDCFLGPFSTILQLNTLLTRNVIGIVL